MHISQIQTDQLSGMSGKRGKIPGISLRGFASRGRRQSLRDRIPRQSLNAIKLGNSGICRHTPE
ncbi:hypothetical protein DENIS_4900 [Desulfonema ishimotonii]|uniref:Uncharacterized protein n=1 Tax=Desulfonema ishimotonii TaxID=45657 RepID=A0A401G3Y8_9BACT|nr:hypothetical protein DENIS_4900 [Desulfonema ishimotonii]